MPFERHTHNGRRFYLFKLKPAMPAETCRQHFFQDSCASNANLYSFLLALLHLRWRIEDHEPWSYCYVPRLSNQSLG